MKIGILTLPLHTNYGGILQAFALYKVISSMGHQVNLIDGKMYEINTFREKMSVLLWKFSTLLGLRKGKHPQLQIRDMMSEIIPFIENNISNIISPCHIKPTTFDAIIVGSDQIWRGEYSPLLPYFLDFASGWDIKRIAYSASFGVSDWNISDNQLKICRELVKKFDLVTVREKEGIEICRNKLECESQWTIDPTMLLQIETYISLVKDKQSQTKGKILTYVLDDNKEVKKIINSISSSMNKEVFNLSLPSKNNINVSVETWLRSFYDCDYVITDSFHGTVFSILLNKPFCVYINKERGSSRFETLLEFTGLLSRVISSQDDLPSLSEKIDWNRVNNKIEEERKRCLELFSLLA